VALEKRLREISRPILPNHELQCSTSTSHPGTNIIYPTLVIEIAKTHETYNELLDDCDTKHFSTMTSVRVWVGVKFTPGDGGRIRVVWCLRDPVNGGILANSGASTGYIPINQPTNIQFIIPKAEVFFGSPAPLPLTLQTIPGPNAIPPPAIAGVPTDDLPRFGRPSGSGSSNGVRHYPFLRAQVDCIQDSGCVLVCLRSGLCARGRVVGWMEE
jgi:hypothetical protein